jgi:hypothetical protein
MDFGLEAHLTERRATCELCLGPSDICKIDYKNARQSRFDPALLLVIIAQEGPRDGDTRMTAVQNATLISAALGAVGTIALFLGSYILEPVAEISHDIGLLLLFLSFVMQAVSVILS